MYLCGTKYGSCGSNVSRWSSQLSAGVGAEELQAGGEGPGLTGRLLLPHVAAVHPVLADPDRLPVVEGLRDLHLIGQVGLPRVALLASNGLPRAVPRVIGAAAVFPVVVMIAGQVRVDARVAEHLGHGIVERLHRSPASMQEVVPPGVDLAAGGHAGHGPDVGRVERRRAGGEALEVRRVDPIAPVHGKHVPVQRVEHHDDGLHFSFLHRGSIVRMAAFAGPRRGRLLRRSLSSCQLRPLFLEALHLRGGLDGLARALVGLVE